MVHALRSTTSIGLLLAVFTAFTAHAPGAASIKPEPAKGPAVVAQEKKSLNVDDIEAMLQAGLSEDLIVAKLRKENRVLDLSPEEMIKLKKLGCSDGLIKVMLDPKAEYKNAAPAPEVQADPAPTQPQRAATDVASANASKEASPLSASALPEEVGVYVLLEGKLVEVQPEIVTWRTGGLIKSMATAGLTKGHVNGKVQGPQSRLKLFAPLEFIIRCPEGVSAAEYQLLQLDEKSDRREFRAVTGGILHASSGAEKNAVPFKFDKVSSRTFKIKLTDIKQGEYGFLPPGAYTSASAASSGKPYTFRIPE
jgi:hypothetical protein